jgi:hypothetical protein
MVGAIIKASFLMVDDKENLQYYLKSTAFIDILILFTLVLIILILVTGFGAAINFDLLYQK